MIVRTNADLGLCADLLYTNAEKNAIIEYIHIFTAFSADVIGGAPVYIELFERVRSRRVRYLPMDGDVLVVHTRGLPYDFHIKVITANIISNSLILDGASLIFIYTPHKDGGIVVHDQSSFYGLAAVHFDGLLPCEFEFIGRENVRDWERDADFGFARANEAVEINEYECELYSRDHDIITDGERLLAVPFFDTHNQKLDHVPYIRMNGEGYATVYGVLYTVAEWLRKNKII